MADPVFGLTGEQVERVGAAVKAFEGAPIDLRRGRAQSSSPPSSPLVQMQVQSISDDHLVCKTWDGTTAGSTEIKVAKPYELRKTVPLPSATYGSWGTGAQTRTNTTVEPDENQSVVPLYIAASTVIYAFRPQGGTGVIVTGVALVWQDSNAGARAWCKV